MTQTDNNLMINGNSPLAIYINNHPVLRIMVNQFKVWPKDVEPDEPDTPDTPDDPIIEILSCFGGGYWTDELPWIDDDVWTD